MFPETNYDMVESSKVPSAKDVDTRRRNSLAFFMRDWQQCETYDQQETSMVQVCGVMDHEGMSNRTYTRTKWNQAAFSTVINLYTAYSKRGAERFNLILVSFCSN